MLGSHTGHQDWEYGDIAENIIQGNGFARYSEFSKNLEITSSHAPFYPLYLSMFYRFGKIPTVIFSVLFIQTIISALTILIFYKISFILFNRTAAVLTAFGLSFYPPLIYYAAKLTPTVFVTFFASLTVLLLLSTEQEQKTAILAGLIIGMSILVNPVMFALLPALFIWNLFGKQIKLKNMALLLLIMFVVLSPWTIRNYLVHRRIVLITTQFGKNFWIGNNPKATGTDYYRATLKDPDNQILMTSTLPRQCKNELTALSEIERSDYFLKKGMEFIERDPTRFLSLILKKTIYFWWFTPPDINGSSDALKFRNLYMVVYLPLIILGIIGIALSLRRRYIKQSLLLILVMIMTSSIYIFTHVGLARYRVPIEAFMIILACNSLGFLKTKFSRQ